MEKLPISFAVEHMNWSGPLKLHIEIFCVKRIPLEGFW